MNLKEKIQDLIDNEIEHGYTLEVLRYLLTWPNEITAPPDAVPSEGHEMSICDLCISYNKTCFIRLADGVRCTVYKPQNLPKADAYSLLADVRAVLQEDYDKLNKMKSSKATGLFRAIYLLDEYISEHFS